MGLTHELWKILLLKAFTEVSERKRLNMGGVQANMFTRRLDYSLFEDEVDFAQLQFAQILEIAPEIIESIGEELK